MLLPKPPADIKTLIYLFSKGKDKIPHFHWWQPLLKDSIVLIASDYIFVIYFGIIPNAKFVYDALSKSII